MMAIPVFGLIFCQFFAFVLAVFTIFCREAFSVLVMVFSVVIGSFSTMGFGITVRAISFLLKPALVTFASVPRLTVYWLVFFAKPTVS